MKCGEWDENNWDALILAIQTGECVLMLGPEASLEDSDNKLQTFSETLAKRLSDTPLIKDVVQTWGINPFNLPQVSMCYSMKTGRTDLLALVRSFYQERCDLTSDFHKSMASLPFYLIITLTHDRLLENALRTLKKDPNIDYYNFKGKKKDLVQMGTKENPLIFYLYGITDDPQSLILTENDHLEFFKAIVSNNPPLPINIASELQSKNKSILFLGFGFRNWYLRILLHSLQIRSKQSRSFALEQFTPNSFDDFKSTIFFFSENDCKIHICKADLNQFSKQLNEKFKNSSPISPEKVYLEDAPTVFICHVSENKKFATSLCKMLEKEGLKPWLDEESIRGGDLWDPKIEKTIKQDIDYFVVLQSDVIAKKNIAYVNKEIFIALDRQKQFRKNLSFIIPVKIEECLLLDDLRCFQTIDLEDFKGFEKLVNTIKRDYKFRQR